MFGPTKQDIRDGIREVIEPKTDIRTSYEMVGRKYLKDGRYGQTKLGRLSEYGVQSDTFENMISKMFIVYDIDAIFFFELSESSTYYPLAYETRANDCLSPIPKYVFVKTNNGFKRVQDISELNDLIRREL